MLQGEGEGDAQTHDTRGQGRSSNVQQAGVGTTGFAGNNKPASSVFATSHGIMERRSGRALSLPRSTVAYDPELDRESD